MDGLALICDFAEVVNGKLYIMGGGWTDVLKTGPITFALAVKLDIPYDRTNEQLLVEARLVDHDGHQVRVDDNEIAMQAKFEVGRPAGIKKGAPTVVPLCWKFIGVDLPHGAYTWRVIVENEDVTTASFTVHPLPQGFPMPGGQ